VAALGLADAQVRRAEAALAYGSFRTSDLVSDWHKTVGVQGHWRPHVPDGRIVTLTIGSPTDIDVRLAMRMAAGWKR
jgi:hypothetical protein